jgi:hypothetical protein
MKAIKNPVMTLIRKSDYTKLIESGSMGMRPIIKLFGGPLTWLVTGIEGGILYGYADLGMGCVEWGSLCHEDELPTFRAGFAFIERDRFFEDDVTINWLEKDSLVGC